MSNYTPGPWQLEIDPISVIEETGRRYQAVWGWAPDRKSIVFTDTLHPDEGTLEQELADVHLIAAAPDLYEALKQIAELALYDIDHEEDGNTYSIEAIARAAVAKAERGAQ